MITASTDFATAIRQKIRQTGAKVQLDVITENAVPNDWSSADQATFSEIEQLTNGVLDCQRRVATCEPDRLKLDGLTAVESANEIGWVSDDLSGADGTINVAFSVGLTTDVTCNGFTIFFDRLDNEYPVDFLVQFYNGGFPGADYLFTDNTDAYITIYDDLLSIDRVQIEIYKWSKPYHRAKCSEIAFGVIEEWGTGTRTGLIEIDSISEIDPSCQSLPYGDALVKIDNRSQAFNIINPAGIARYLREGAKMQVFHGVKVNGDYEFVKTGTYFFKKWEDSGNNAVNLTAVDSLGYYADKEGRLTYGVGQTDVSFWMSQFRQAMGYPPFDLSTLPLSRAILARPFDKFIVELQKFCQSIMMVAVCDPDGIIRFKTLSDAVQTTIPRSLSKKDPKIKQDEQIASVEVAFYSKVKAENTERIIDQSYTVNGSLTLSFDVGYDYDNFVATVTNGTVGYTAALNGKVSVTITYTGTTNLILAGKKISFTRSSVTVANPNVTDPNAKKLVIDNKLIPNEDQALELAQFTIDHYNEWYKYDCQWIGDPLIEVGDVALIENKFGDARPARIIKRELTFNGGLSSELEAKGE